MLHCCPCGSLPVWRAQASAGLACCHTGWPFRGARIPTGRRAHVASLCPVANGPATGGRLGVAANLNNRTRQVALAGCGACCTIAVASSGVRPGIHCGTSTTGIPGGRAPVLWPLRCSGRAARWLARTQRKATIPRCEAACEASIESWRWAAQTARAFHHTSALAHENPMRRLRTDYDPRMLS
jgi:hypothetical protein